MTDIGKLGPLPPNYPGFTAARRAPMDTSRRMMYAYPPLIPARYKWLALGWMCATAGLLLWTLLR